MCRNAILPMAAFLIRFTSNNPSYTSCRCWGGQHLAAATLRVDEEGLPCLARTRLRCARRLMPIYTDSLKLHVILDTTGRYRPGMTAAFMDGATWEGKPLKPSAKPHVHQMPVACRKALPSNHGRADKRPIRSQARRHGASDASIAERAEQGAEFTTPRFRHVLQPAQISGNQGSVFAW